MRCAFLCVFGNENLTVKEMGLTRRMAAPVLFLLLVLIATEMGTTTAGDDEARHCLSQSHKFKGLCLSSSNCEKVCATENFPGGECKMEGPMRKCFCKKPC